MYASATGPKLTFFSNSQWLKLFAGNPAKSYGVWNEALGLTSSRVKEQADYARALSECMEAQAKLGAISGTWAETSCGMSETFQAGEQHVISSAVNAPCRSQLEATSSRYQSLHKATFKVS